jgi:predicted DNA-binding protein (MmcQ/YjbR family)
MPKSAKAKDDPRLARVSKICLALPEAAICRQGKHAGYMVGKKTFAWFLHNHHGDGMVAISCKVLPGDNHALAAAQPERFYLPAYMAHHGWVALRLDRGEIDWEEVSELIACSYQLVAPKRLAAQVKVEE